VHDALTRQLEPVRGLRSILLVAALVAGSASLLAVRTGPAPAPVQPPVDHTVHCAEATDTSEQMPSPLDAIELEHRWLVGQFASPAEVDAALGAQIAPWTQFTYVFDSQPRQAIASPIYASTSRVEHVFGRDGYDGVWLDHTVELRATKVSGDVTYTRDIYLLPVGSSFRGVR
jgi:hypothetical protein